MQNELLDLIDQIEMQQAIAEMEVCNALLNSYSKSCMILENASDTTDMSSFEIFQESCEVYQEGEKWDRVKDAGSKALKEAKGDKSENIVIRILKFIPRLIMAFVRNLRTNKKQMDKKIDAIEKSAEEIVEAVEKGDDKGNHLVIDTNDVHWVDKDGKIIGSGIEAVEKGIDEDAAKNKKSAESPDTSKFVMKDGGKQLDDKAVRDLRKRTVAKQKTMALPYDEYNYSFRYANGDICFNFAWETFNMLEKMNTKTLDYAELMLPIESALEIIVDAFSVTRLNSKGKPDYDQKSNTSDLVYNVRTRDLPGKIVLIKNKIKEADQWMSELNKNFNKNWKINTKGDVRECKLSEVLQAFRYASQWIGQTEKILETSAKRIKSVVDHLPTFKSGSAHDPYDRRELQAATYLKTEDANTITACVNRVQTLVDQANKRFAYIVKNCSDALDEVYAAAYFAAGKAGITTESLDKLSSLRNWARVVPVPDKRGEMFDNVDIHGYRKGVRDFNDLIRAPRD